MDRRHADELLKLVPGASVQFDGDTCVSINLTNPDHVYHGLIRHADQSRVMELLSMFPGLKLLDLRKNKVRDFSLLCPEKLEYLDLSSNYLGTLPKWLSKATRLRFLSLGVNELDFIPDYLADFKELRTLKLHKNHLKSLPDLSGCVHLEFLNLYLNKMNRIPEWVWGLGQIEFFSWGVSSLAEIPPQIGNWQRLKWLSLVANKIRRLPNEFCTLSNLQGVRLHKNELEELPRRFAELKKLRELTLYMNRLKEFPFEEMEFDKLNLGKNPLLRMPQFNRLPKWLRVDA